MGGCLKGRPRRTKEKSDRGGAPQGFEGKINISRVSLPQGEGEA